MSTKVKLGIVVSIVLVIVAGFFWRKQTVQSKTASAVELHTASRIKFIKSVSSSGKTKADRQVDLKFQTSGLLTWVGVKEGDTIAKGQVIAQIDSRDVQKGLEKALRDYSNTRNDFEETWRVTYKGLQNPDGALTDTVKRILQKNQWNLEKSVLDVELKNISLEYSRLVSPIAGIVTRIDTPVAGVNITPAGAVFQVIDPSSIVFEAKIDETDVGDLAIGQTAEVALDAFSGKTFTGIIKSISYSAETSTGGATVFPVKIQITADSALRVGYNGDVTIGTKELPDSLVVPLSAIREDGKTKYVFKKVGDSYTKSTIQTTISNEDVSVISSGLSEGDQIVIKGFSSVTTN